MSERAAERVQTVDLSKVKREALEVALHSLGIDTSKFREPSRMVEVLIGRIGNEGDACTNCGGRSSVDQFEACPFCGEGEEPAETSAEDPAQSGEYEILDPEAVANMSLAVPTAKEKALVRRDKKSEKPSKAIAPTQKAEIVTATEEDLDRDVEEIRALDRTMRTYTWKLACKLAEVNDSMRWKVRRAKDEHGTDKVAYRMFEEFANAELDITREYAQLLVRVAGRFSEEEVVSLGVTKLRVVLGAPVHQQQAAMKLLVEGKSRREVERHVRPESTSSDLQQNREKKKQAKSEGKLKAATPASNNITVAVTPARHTIKLYKKPESQGAKEVRAKQIGDSPWGYFDLTNDVRLFFTFLKDGNGELIAKLDIRRQDPTT